MTPLPDVLRILVVDDEPPIRQFVGICLRQQGYEVAEAESASQAMALLHETPFHALITDERMPETTGTDLMHAAHKIHPDLPVVMFTAHPTVDHAVATIRSGAYDYLPKPFTTERLLRTVRRATEHGLLAQRLRAFESSDGDDLGIVGRSNEIRRLRSTVRHLARFSAPVLITGETGVGKELVARALHAAGPRADGPFVSVNAAAIPETLCESMLFGHVAGAFSGAMTSNEGLFVAADGGTLLLDEIGEMSLANQARLLRAVETMEVRAVGSTMTRRVDVRLVACTNRSPHEAVAAGAIREDLYYRLRGLHIAVAPLRERREDISVLARHFLRQACDEHDLPPIAMDDDLLVHLENSSLPGNVRELRQLVTQMAIMSRGRRLDYNDLPTQSPDLQQDAAKRSLREIEAMHVARVLASVQGNRSAAAEVLGVSRRTLYRLLDKHQIHGKSPDVPNARENRADSDRLSK